MEVQSFKSLCTCLAKFIFVPGGGDQPAETPELTTGYVCETDGSLLGGPHQIPLSGHISTGLTHLNPNILSYYGATPLPTGRALGLSLREGGREGRREKPRFLREGGEQRKQRRTGSETDTVEDTGRDRESQRQEGQRNRPGDTGMGRRPSLS